MTISYIKRDGKIYKVTTTEELVDLEELEEEKVNILAYLGVKKPTDKELAELAKDQHPYYQDKTRLEKRLDAINEILAL
jgi:hypothetical protein